ncbi:MAG: ABC transporter ATP-binding protein [Marmoricola sp.]
MSGLQLRGVTVRYDGEVGVDDVGLEVPTGRIVALLGPSGSGKSTLLRTIAGIESLAAGAITFDGEDVTRVPVHRRGFALMFQDGQLFENRSVARNVGYGLRLRKLSAAVRKERVNRLLHLVGLESLADRMPDTLSGGQRQRVALARALAVEPRLLLLDEPLSSLDRSHREELAPQLRAILTTAGTATLLVTHDHEEAFAIADDLVVMREGRVVQSGPIGDVWRQPADAWVARFLGYPTVLTGEAARTLIAALPEGSGNAWAAVALRRSALRIDDGGPLEGVVVSARAGTDVLRLVVQIPEVGTVPAVAAPGTLIEPGGAVFLVPDVNRMAGLATRD